MTACMLISPNDMCIPTIISDTVISSNHSPSNVVNESNRFKTRLTRIHDVFLARKSYILSDSCAVAFSGEENKIQDFLEYARPLINANRDNDRPMRSIGDRAEQYKQGIDVIGYFVKNSDNDSFSGNYVRPDMTGTVELGKLGFCSAIGSGGHDIIKLARELEASFDVNMNPMEVVFNAVRLINQSRIAEEIYNPNIDESWGGFFEHLYFDAAKKCWIRQGKTLCIHYQVCLNGNIIDNLGLVDRVIAYDPGGNVGNILCIFDGIDTKFVNYSLKNLLDDPDEVVTADELWRRWIPEKILVTVAIGKIENDGMFSNRKYYAEYDNDEYNPTTLIIEDSYWEIVLENKKIDNIINSSIDSYLASL